MVRVLVVDDQELLREGIASLLAVQEGIEIVGTAENGKIGVELALALRPDVLLMDVQMPVMDGVAATAQIRSQLPASRVLMLTTFDDQEYIIEAPKAGANGYLLKNIPTSDLAKTIQTVHKGVYQLDPIVAAKVVASLTSGNSAPIKNDNTRPERARIAELTNREVEVLHLIAKGVSNREIAQSLLISEGTTFPTS